MQDDVAERHVYPINPVRRWLGWMIFGPFALGGLIAVIFTEGRDRVASMVLGAAFVLFSLGMHWLLSRPRLEVSPSGVRMHQIGTTVETAWTNVQRLRMDRGQEAFVTAVAMEGKGARRLSASRETGTYDRTAQGLLYEQRYIPIEVFSWHLRRGLGEDLRRFAPHLQAALEAGPPPAVKQRVNKPALAAVVAILVGFGIVAFMWPNSLGTALDVCWGVLMPFIALQCGISGVKALRAKAWLIGVLSLIFAVIMILWDMAIWAEVANGSKGHRKVAKPPVAGAKAGLP